MRIFYRCGGTPYLARVVPERRDEKLVPERSAVRLVVHQADACVAENNGMGSG